jgi:hypothetical protein
VAIIAVEVVNELGECKVPSRTRTYLTAAIMPSFDDESWPLLRFVDAYGDTVFNRLQVPELLHELKRLSDLATTDEQRETVRETIALADESIKQPHLYQKFMGD